MIKIDYDPKEFREIDGKLGRLSEELGRDTLRKAVNDTARETHAKIIRDMPQFVDRPKQITLKSLYVKFASGNRLDAFIEFKAYAGKKIFSKHWLSSMVFGGDRRDKGLEKALRHFNMLPAGYMAVPTKDVRTDGYGNVPGGYVTAIISFLRIDMSSTQNRPRGKLNARQWRTQIRRQKRFFVVRVGEKNNLSPGIYEYRSSNGGRAIRKVFNFLPVTYKQTFPFFDIASKFARSRLVQRFNDRFDSIIRGSR